MPTRAETARRRNTDALAKLGPIWLPPDKALLIGYAPKSRMERLIVRDVLVPTLRHYAAEVAGQPSPIEDVRSHVLFAQMQGLRTLFATDWAWLIAHPAPDSVTPIAAWAAAWYGIGEEERAALSHYFRTGKVLDRPKPLAPAADLIPDLWGALASA